MKIRRAKLSDNEEQIYNLLSELSPSPPWEDNKYIFYGPYSQVYGRGNSMMWVAEINGEIVGICRLVVDIKLTRGGGRAGRIEEVVVNKSYRGCGVGKQLIDKAIEKAKKLNCYKVTLACTPNNTAFYEKCGFHQHEIEMRKDL